MTVELEQILKTVELLLHYQSPAHAAALLHDLKAASLRNTYLWSIKLLDSGRVKVHQQKKQYDFEIKGAKVFATCNEINRLSKPLQSRFRKLFLPRYTEQQFIDVSVKLVTQNWGEYGALHWFHSIQKWWGY